MSGPMTWERLLSPRRHRPEDGGDGRSPFQLDCHRVTLSASFRRLQGKTQVFPPDAPASSRTRLTHSLEVASFAKTLGQTVFAALIKKGVPGVTERTREDAADVLQCAGLLHDIGNPPFGHFGESALREWFRDNLNKLKFQGSELGVYLNDQMKGDFLLFDGNARALRLVAKLSYPVDGQGMNLTRATLGAMIKYPVPSGQAGGADVRSRKAGYFYAERELFEEISEDTGTYGRRSPLAFLLEAADDIAYATADIEDAAGKGFVSPRLLPEELRGVRCLAFCRSGDAKEEYLKLVDALDSSLKECAENGRPEQTALQNWVVRARDALIKAAAEEFLSHYGEIMAGEYPTSLLEGAPGGAVAAALCDIAARYVFRSEYIVRLELSAGTVMSRLLDAFVPAALLYDTGMKMSPIEQRLQSLMPESYKYVCRKYSAGRPAGERVYLRLMLAADYICGMTDGYARELCRRLDGEL